MGDRGHSSLSSKTVFSVPVIQSYVFNDVTLAIPFSCDESGNFLNGYFVEQIFTSTNAFLSPVFHICLNEYSRVDHEFRIFN